MNKLGYMSIAALAMSAFLIVGCAKPANSGPTANNSNNAAANSTTGTANANSSAAATPASESKTYSAPAGSLATPGDAYKFAYDCRKRKDIECLKKVFSKDVMDFFNAIGKDDNKTPDDFLKELVEKPQAATCEFRKEKIDGTHATLEYLDEKGDWKTMDFDKFGSEWRMGFPKMDGVETGPKK